MVKSRFPDNYLIMKKILFLTLILFVTNVVYSQEKERKFVFDVNTIYRYKSPGIPTFIPESPWNTG